MISHLKQVLNSEMTKRDLKPHVLEKKCNLTRGVVYNILNDKSKNPSLDTVIALSKEFNISLDSMLGNDSADLENKQKSYKSNALFNYNLFIGTVNYIAEFIREKEIEPKAEEVFSLLKEIYMYSYKSNKEHLELDQSFAEWLLEKI